MVIAFLGFFVIISVDGREGFHRGAQQIADIIRQLRETSTKLAIVAIATANTEGFKETMLRAGANNYIPKSRLAKDLVPAVRKEISMLSGMSMA